MTEYGSTIHNNWLVWPFVGPFPFFSSAFHTWTDSYLLSHGWHSRAVDQFLTLIRGYENSVAKERRRWNPKMIELCSLKTRSIKRLSVRPQRDDGVLRTLMGTLSARVCVFGWPTALTPLWKLCEPRTKKCTIIYWLIYGLVPRKCAHVWKQCRQCAFTAGLCVEVNLIPANLDCRALPDFAYAVNVRVVGVDIIGLNVYRLMLVVSCWRIRVMCEHKPIVRGATSVSARFLFMSFSDGFMVHKAEQRWKENQNGSLPTFSMRRTARRTAPIKAASEWMPSIVNIYSMLVGEWWAFVAFPDCGHARSPTLKDGHLNGRVSSWGFNYARFIAIDNSWWRSLNNALHSSSWRGPSSRGRVLCDDRSQSSRGQPQPHTVIYVPLTGEHLANRSASAIRCWKSVTASEMFCYDFIMTCFELFSTVYLNQASSEKHYSSSKRISSWWATFYWICIQFGMKIEVTGVINCDIRGNVMTSMISKLTNSITITHLRNSEQFRCTIPKSHTSGNMSSLRK